MDNQGERRRPATLKAGRSLDRRGRVKQPKARRHLVLYKRRGERYVLRCFDCAWAVTVRDHAVALECIAGHAEWTAHTMGR